MGKKRISMLVDEETWEEFKKRAAEKKLTASFVARTLIEQYSRGDLDISLELRQGN